MQKNERGRFPTAFNELAIFVQRQEGEVQPRRWGKWDIQPASVLRSKMTVKLQQQTHKPEGQAQTYPSK